MVAFWPCQLPQLCGSENYDKWVPSSTAEIYSSWINLTQKRPGWHAILTWSLLLWRLLKRHFSSLIDSWHDRGSKNWVTNSQETWDMCLRSASIFEAERITAFGMTPMTPKFCRGDAFSQHDPTLPESLAASEANQPHAPSGDSISGEPRPIDPRMAASMAADSRSSSI